MAKIQTDWIFAQHKTYDHSVQYCLKIKTITFGLYSPKVDLTTNSRYFPTW